MAAMLQLLADLATGVALLTIPVLALYLAFTGRLKMNGLYWLLVVLLVAGGAMHLTQATPGLRESNTLKFLVGGTMAVLSWAALIDPEKPGVSIRRDTSVRSSPIFIACC